VELEGERDVEATLQVSAYRAGSSPPTPTLLVVSSPAVRSIENVDETADPARAVALPELLVTVQDQYADVRDRSQVGERSVTLLGNETTLETYQATATVDGESVTVSVRVATVRDGDDYVTVVGIVPAERSDVDPVRRLAEDVTHEK